MAAMFDAENGATLSTGGQPCGTLLIQRRDPHDRCLAFHDVMDLKLRDLPSQGRRSGERTIGCTNYPHER